MDNIRINKKTIIICILILFIVGVIALYFKLDDSMDFNEGNGSYGTYNVIKHYNANEVVPVYINESDVVKKYLNIYKNNMIYDINEAYNMLNERYREERFGSIEAYQEYINSIISSSTYSMEVDKYSVNKINGVKIFSVFDKSGYQYIIKEKSIMDIEIYLDEYTVEIK